MKYKNIKILNFILFITLAFFSCDDSENDIYSRINFERKSVMPGTGRASAVGFAINGKGYVALGRYDANSAVLNDCWEYDPENDSWTRKADFPGVGRVKATAVTLNGFAYVGLGYNPLKGMFNDTAYLRDWWKYDPQLNKWFQLAYYPGSGRVANVSFVLNGIIYVGAGYQGLSFTSELYAFDPLTGKWTRKENIIGKSRSGAVACSNGERAFFGTGFTAFDENDWYEYFPVSDTWKKRKSLPDTGRENGVAMMVDNRFFVSTGRNFGGEFTGGHLKSDIVEYDPVKNKWHKRGNIKSGERENAISFVIDNKAYIGFGENDTTIINDLWCFEP